MEKNAINQPHRISFRNLNPSKMRIGLISAATYQYLDQPMRAGSNHGTAFASTFNGFDEAEVKKT